MTHKTLFALALCLTLSGCGQTPAEVPAPTSEPVAEAPTITVAPIEGQTLSPDGKWEVVQSGVSEGVTSAGLYPCEGVQIVNTETGEVLWEGAGAYQLHAAWPLGSRFAVIARTARTFVEVEVVSTRSGESLPARLPGEKPIPEYTFLAENWIRQWDENTFELRLDGGDGLLSYRCSVMEDPPVSPFDMTVVQAVYEELPVEFDFTHDGKEESVQLVTILRDDGTGSGEPRPLWNELYIADEKGERLWWDEAHFAHAGWNSLFACTVEGKDYILNYGPTMYQGLASYSYELFSLTEDGEEVLAKENAVSFDVNFGSPIFTGNYDPAAIGAFMEDVHSYLNGDCTLLLSTWDNQTQINVPGSEFRGADIWGLYEQEGTWEERFIWFRDSDPRG